MVNLEESDLNFEVQFLLNVHYFHTSVKFKKRVKSTWGPSTW